MGKGSKSTSGLFRASCGGSLGERASNEGEGEGACCVGAPIVFDFLEVGESMRPSREVVLVGEECDLERKSFIVGGGVTGLYKGGYCGVGMHARGNRFGGLSRRGYVCYRIIP